MMKMITRVVIAVVERVEVNAIVLLMIMRDVPALFAMFVLNNDSDSVAVN